MKNSFKLFIVCSLIFVVGELNAQDQYQVFEDLVRSDSKGCERVNIKDSQGMKQGKWIYFGKDRPSSGISPRGIVEEGYFVNDRKEGLWIKYHKDGITPKLKANYKNNVPLGQYEKIYPNGNVREIGTFLNGKYIDSLIRYNPDGSISFEAFYNIDGFEEGKVIYYSESGKKELEYLAMSGRPFGDLIRYDAYEEIIDISCYRFGQYIAKKTANNVHSAHKKETRRLRKNKAPRINQMNKKSNMSFNPNGYNTVYNKLGEIWQDGQFKDGRLYDGKVYEYDQEGILFIVKVYREGNYYADGQL